MPTSAVIGIDPGSKGVAVLITEDRHFDCARFMKGMAHVRAKLLDWTLNYDVKTFRESVQARSTDFKPQLFQFGYNTGMIDGLLLAFFLVPDMVHDKSWQYEFGLGAIKAPPCEHKQPCRACKDGEKMRRYAARAHEIFPQCKVTQDMGAGILIAEYAWRKTYGSLGNERKTENLRAGTGVVRVVERTKSSARRRKD